MTLSIRRALMLGILLNGLAHATSGSSIPLPGTNSGVRMRSSRHQRVGSVVYITTEKTFNVKTCVGRDSSDDDADCAAVTRTTAFIHPATTFEQNCVFPSEANSGKTCKLKRVNVTLEFGDPGTIRRVGHDGKWRVSFDKIGTVKLYPTEFKTAKQMNFAHEWDWDNHWEWGYGSANMNERSDKQMHNDTRSSNHIIGASTSARDNELETETDSAGGNAGLTDTGSARGNTSLIDTGFDYGDTSEIDTGRAQGSSHANSTHAEDKSSAEGGGGCSFLGFGVNAKGGTSKGRVRKQSENGSQHTSARDRRLKIKNRSGRDKRYTSGHTSGRDKRSNSGHTSRHGKRREALRASSTSLNEQADSRGTTTQTGAESHVEHGVQDAHLVQVQCKRCGLYHKFTAGTLTQVLAEAKHLNTPCVSPAECIGKLKIIAKEKAQRKELRRLEEAEEGDGAKNTTPRAKKTPSHAQSVHPANAAALANLQKEMGVWSATPELPAEVQRFATTLHEISRERHPINSDGNCLVRALGHAIGVVARFDPQLLSNPRHDYSRFARDHTYLRERLVEQLQAYAERNPHLVIKQEDINNLLLDGRWRNDAYDHFLQVAAEFLGLNIAIYDVRGRLMQQLTDTIPFNPTMGREATLCLIYTGNHYDSTDYVHQVSAVGSDGVTDSDGNQLQQIEAKLAQWKLGRYANSFLEHGFDDPEEWSHITNDQLQGIGMKEGHIAKFLRAVSAPDGA